MIFVHQTCNEQSQTKTTHSVAFIQKRHSYQLGYNSDTRLSHATAGGTDRARRPSAHFNLAADDSRQTTTLSKSTGISSETKHHNTQSSPSNWGAAIFRTPQSFSQLLVAIFPSCPPPHQQVRLPLEHGHGRTASSSSQTTRPFYQSRLLMMPLGKNFSTGASPSPKKSCTRCSTAP